MIIRCAKCMNITCAGAWLEARQCRLMATCSHEGDDSVGIRARARAACRDWARCPQDNAATQGDDDMVVAFSAGQR
jgi:hypothetical protein